MLESVPPLRRSIARRAHARSPARLLVVLVMAVLGCRSGPAREGDALTAPTRPIAAVIADHAPRLMAMGGITAVGESALPDGTPCIRVFLLARDPVLEKRIPPRIEGHPVVVLVSGEIKAMPEGK